MAHPLSREGKKKGAFFFFLSAVPELPQGCELLKSTVPGVWLKRSRQHECRCGNGPDLCMLCTVISPLGSPLKEQFVPQAGGHCRTSGFTSWNRCKNCVNTIALFALAAVILGGHCCCVRSRRETFRLLSPSETVS